MKFPFAVLSDNERSGGRNKRILPRQRGKHRLLKALDQQWRSVEREILGSQKLMAADLARG